MEAYKEFATKEEFDKEIRQAKVQALRDLADAWTGQAALGRSATLVDIVTALRVTALVLEGDR